jgi:hypothetical protein
LRLRRESEAAEAVRTKWPASQGKIQIRVSIPAKNISDERSIDESRPISEPNAVQNRP